MSPGDVLTVAAHHESPTPTVLQEKPHVPYLGHTCAVCGAGRGDEGQFGLFEWNMQPHTGGADAHVHKTFSESFFVMSGTVELYDGNRWMLARPGDFLYVPMGGVHAFRALSDEPSTMLILFAPGAPRERYFRELAAIREDGRTLSEEEWTRFLAQHHQYRAE